MGNCNNIFCSSINRDGTCGDFDHDGDRIEWCPHLKLYKEYFNKNKNAIALLKECVANGDVSAIQLCAWYTDNRQVIDQVITDAEHHQ